MNTSMENEEEAKMDDCESNLNSVIGKSAKIKDKAELTYFEAFRASSASSSKTEAKQWGSLQADLNRYNSRYSKKDEVSVVGADCENIVSLLRDGKFNVLLYGIGSKSTLLEYISQNIVFQEEKPLAINLLCNGENFKKQFVNKMKHINSEVSAKDTCKDIIQEKIKPKLKGAMLFLSLIHI